MFSNKQVYQFIQKSIKQKQNIVVTSVIKTLGSTYSKAGSIFVINEEGKTCGVLGSPKLHNKLLELSKQALETKEVFVLDNIPSDESSGHGESKFFIQAFFYEENYGLLQEALENTNKTLVRSIIDGRYFFEEKQRSIELKENLFYQTIKKTYSLLVFGAAAHVEPLIKMANLLGWKTTVIDIKINNEFVRNADKVIKLDEAKEVLNIDFKQYDASVILSHRPSTDEVYLQALASSNIEYIGMMGNKKNMASIKNKLGLNNDKRVFAPVGLDIGSNSSESIALSICAQIESKRNGKI
ncbi:XdhC family protein [Halarcobacter sp.]|uniref:XdhC family protein n=1 Tax=Halarcobacter sp. TaxID=2321133 RepID=UPI003A95283D